MIVATMNPSGTMKLPYPFSTCGVERAIVPTCQGRARMLEKRTKHLMTGLLLATVALGGVQ